MYYLRRSGELRVQNLSVGFTLVELSVVLVIIGLIVGGILVGRELVLAAQIRQTISQFERFNAAANTFRTKYQYLPGDFPDAAAFGFELTSAGNGDGIVGPCGEGNSQTDTDCFAGYSECYDTVSPSHELVDFWYHLGVAGLIGFESLAASKATCDTNVANPPWEQVGYAAGKVTPSAPVNARSGSHGWVVRSEMRFTRPASQPGGVPPDWTLKIMSGHTLALATSVTGFAMVRDVQRGFRPSDIAAIDRKLDDGKPVSGMMQIVEGDYFPPENAHSQAYYSAQYACGNDPGGFGARCACNTAGGTDWEYNLVVEPTNRFCVPVFRAAF